MYGHEMREEKRNKKNKRQRKRDGEGRIYIDTYV